MGTDDYRTPARYQFGHTDLAARRLAVVARVFRSSTESFLREAGLRGVRRALDLGCGPGHTTRLLAEILPEAEITGLDVSPEFLAEALSAGSARVAYARCDVVAEALPGPPVGLAFCRFLLSHLANPLAQIARWGAALAPGGMALAEEVEAIHPKQSAFRFYLGLVEAMLAAQGSTLYVGAALSEAKNPAGLQRCLDRIYNLAVTPSDAARMFSMNVPNWKDLPLIRERCSPGEIEALQNDLARLAEAPDGEPVEWELRQIAWRRLP